MLPLHTLQITTDTETPGCVRIAGRLMRSIGITVTLGLGPDNPFQHTVEQARLRIARALWEDAYGEIHRMADDIRQHVGAVVPSYATGHDLLLAKLELLSAKLDFPGLPPVPYSVRTELPRINLG